MKYLSVIEKKHKIMNRYHIVLWTGTHCVIWRYRLLGYKCFLFDLRDYNNFSLHIYNLIDSCRTR